MARLGTYENTLNRMLKANGLPPVVVPGDVPSEDVFGTKVTTKMGEATVRE